MSLDHERLDVYNVALDFLVFANEVIERLPRGRSHLCDQLTRASTSIVLNLAEGAGKHSKPDKRRYYLTARASATESAALLDTC
jgi:four helix bundle protein